MLRNHNKLGYRMRFSAIILATIVVAAIAHPVRSDTPDTLVICPALFKSELAAWIEHREFQGHRIHVIEPARSAAEMHIAIKRIAQPGGLKYLVLIGDVAAARNPQTKVQDLALATNHVAARINTRWGSEPHIASDIPYADLDGDGAPDLAVGRIPADSPLELRHALTKAIRYERQTDDGDWQQRLDVVAGVGGFGTLADAVIEAAGRQVFQQAVPAGYEMRHISAKSASNTSNWFCETACKNFNDGSLAWIYLGHGQPTELDRVVTPTGRKSILSVDDLATVRCKQCRPLAVLVACYTGAFDAQKECLAEKLAVASEGPVAVIAATRVTMPYGNTVFGYELLRACFTDRPASLGDAMRLAQCRVLCAQENDTFRPSLDSMASGLSPAPVDLAGERREHVFMYHLFGDPLLRLRIDSKEPTIGADPASPVIGTATLAR